MECTNCGQKYFDVLKMCFIVIGVCVKVPLRRCTGSRACKLVDFCLYSNRLYPVVVVEHETIWVSGCRKQQCSQMFHSQLYIVDHAKVILHF